MKYAVVAKHTKKFSELEIPDFNLSWEYPLSISLEKLQAAARQRLMGALQTFIDTREEIPLPAFTAKQLNEEYGGANYRAKGLTIPWQVVLKIEVYRAWRESKLTEIGLVKATGLSRSGFRNLLKLDANAEVRSLALIFDALGYKIDFTVAKKTGVPKK